MQLRIMTKIVRAEASKTVFIGSLEEFGVLSLEKFYALLKDKSLLNRAITLWVETQEDASDPIDVTLDAKVKSAENVFDQLKEESEKLAVA